MKRTLILLAAIMTASFSFADITTAPWIAMQEDDTIVVPLIHSPFIKKTLGNRSIGMYQMPMMRRVFQIEKKKQIASATLDICGLGHFECFIDGKKVGNHFLDPGWSDYRKEAEYVRFDVLPFFSTKEQNLRLAARTEGSNKRTKEHVLGVLLGNGFYNIPRQRYTKLLGSFGAPKLKCSLTIRYTDGTVQEIQSDQNWKVTDSPITFSSIYGGEDYDARMEQSGWDCNPKFNDKAWAKPRIVQPAFEPTLVKQEGTELVIADTLIAQSIIASPLPTKEDPDQRQRVWIYDFGKNLSGIVQLTLRHPVESGRTIRMRPGELLHSNGAINQNVAKPYFFEYISKGSNGTESFTPKFSYYGFRYVELSGIHPDSIELKMLHTTSVTCLHPVGDIEAPNDTIRQVHDLIDNAIRSNLASIPTDCPTREKLGWLEQDYLMLPSMLCRYDMKPIYRRLMRQMAQAQQPDGMIPTIAPYYTYFGYGFDDSPEWGAAFILSPWILYQHDGDSSLIEQYYPQMKRYIQYLYTRAKEERDSIGQVTKPNHIISYGLGDWYDLGPNGPGYSQLTPNGLTATAIYFEEVSSMAKMAKALMQTSDAQQYTLLADSIREAYRIQFDTCQSQTALAMGLHLHLLPDSLRSWAQERLLADLETPHTTSDAKGKIHWNTLLTTGDIGFVYLVRTLSEMGRDDLLMQLCTRTDIPGYGMQLNKGATSLCESWQALENVSNNHLMLGHILEWLYSRFKK